MIEINKLNFDLLIPKEKIDQKVVNLAKEIDNFYASNNTNPVPIIIMDGAFIFAADLLRHMTLDLNPVFTKISSYSGIQQEKIIQFKETDFTFLQNQSVLIIEDILDSGNTMAAFLELIKKFGINDIKICSLLVKPEILRKDVKVDWFGFEISPLFVIGYGMDYNGYGRGLADIYQLHIN